MRFEVTILGVNAAMPANGRHLTAQVLNVRENLFLIDCGEGTQMRLSACNVRRRGRIEHIFISHLHGDHIFGLMGLLTSFSLNGRQKPLHIYGPKGLKEFIDVQLRISQSYMAYTLHVHVTNPEVHELIFENDDVWVYTIPLKHRIPTNGYLFREKERPRRILPEMIERYQLKVPQIRAIKAGQDFITDTGERIPHEQLTIAPPHPRSYAFCSDTAYHQPIVPIIQGVDLLYHEATFLHRAKARAAATFHSTAVQAAQIAQQAQVKRLLLGHYSSRYKDLDPLLHEAKSVFPNSLLAYENHVYRVESSPLFMKDTP